MTDISFEINGAALRTFAQRITTAEGLQEAAPLVGDNIVLPGADGALNVYELGEQRRPDGEARLTLALSVRGVDPATGELDAATTLTDYLGNCDAMIRLLYSRSLTIDAERPDGSVRRAVGHLVPGESLNFTRERSHPAFGTYVATIAIPSGRWTDTTSVTTGAQSLASGLNLDLSAFAAATAACTDLEVTFGPGLNPRLDKADGFMAWDGEITAGRELVIYTRTSLTGAGSGTAWEPGYSFSGYSPGPRFFEVDPTQPLEATFTHDTGSAMTVEISGPRHYRTC